jgi:2-C-methyl-D-erythritol 2,4-cyclodiphosphate synthase
MVRVGIGYDSHRYDQELPLVLGGRVISVNNGLSGHSDADVLIHAIVDAMLGATALGDIGRHFPNTDPRWKGTASSEFLTYTQKLTRRNGWNLQQIDATIVAEQPTLFPEIDSIRESLAEILQLPISCIGLKASTNEGMGWIGRREGMAVIAVVTMTEYKEAANGQG